MSQLLRKVPENRLGAGERDAEEVKSHKLFQVVCFIYVKIPLNHLVPFYHMGVGKCFV